MSAGEAPGKIRLLDTDGSQPASPLESPGERFKLTSAGWGVGGSRGQGMENGCLTGTGFPFWGDENMVELQ